jgi:hypothetical protein
VRSIWCSALVLAACGDPLADGDFVGEPMVNVQAIVCGAQSDRISPLNPHLGIGWKSYDNPGWSLDDVTAVHTPSFPAIVDVELFDPPLSHAPLVLPTERRLVEADVGCPVMFDDLDYDGRFGEADVLLAVSWNHLLVFVRGEARAFTHDGPFRLTGDDRDGSYRLFEGVCDEQGAPTGELRPAWEGQPIEVTFLEAPDTLPVERHEKDCTAFF